MSTLYNRIVSHFDITSGRKRGKEEILPINDVRRSITQHNIWRNDGRLVDKNSTVIDDSDILAIHSWQGSCSRRNRWRVNNGVAQDVKCEHVLELCLCQSRCRTGNCLKSRIGWNEDGHIGQIIDSIGQLGADQCIDKVGEASCLSCG